MIMMRETIFFLQRRLSSDRELRLIFLTFSPTLSLSLFLFLRFSFFSSIQENRSLVFGAWIKVCLPTTTFISFFLFFSLSLSSSLSLCPHNFEKKKRQRLSSWLYITWEKEMNLPRRETLLFLSRIERERDVRKREKWVQAQWFPSLSLSLKIEGIWTERTKASSSWSTLSSSRERERGRGDRGRKMKE